jgi:hypothetical protein
MTGKSMHTHIARLIASILLIAPLQAIGQVYKWVDENGRTIYSSTPPPAGTKNPVVLPPPPAPQPSPPPPAVSAKKPEPAKPADKKPDTAKQAGGGAYTTAQLTSPTPDEVIWSNSGDVPFSIALQPSLRQGHKIRLILNGAPHAEIAGEQGTLSNLDRGTYSLQAEVLDRDGRAVASTNSVTFTVHQASSQGPTQKKKGK